MPHRDDATVGRDRAVTPFASNVSADSLNYDAMAYDYDFPIGKAHPQTFNGLDGSQAHVLRTFTARWPPRPGIVPLRSFRIS